MNASKTFQLPTSVPTNLATLSLIASPYPPFCLAVTAGQNGREDHSKSSKFLKTEDKADRVTRSTVLDHSPAKVILITTEPDLRRSKRLNGVSENVEQNTDSAVAKIPKPTPTRSSKRLLAKSLNSFPKVASGFGKASVRSGSVSSQSPGKNSDCENCEPNEDMNRHYRQSWQYGHGDYRRGQDYARSQEASHRASRFEHHRWQSGMMHREYEFRERGNFHQDPNYGRRGNQNVFHDHGYGNSARSYGEHYSGDRLGIYPPERHYRAWDHFGEHNFRTADRPVSSSSWNERYRTDNNNFTWGTVNRPNNLVQVRRSNSYGGMGQCNKKISSQAGNQRSDSRRYPNKRPGLANSCKLPEDIVGDKAWQNSGHKDARIPLADPASTKSVKVSEDQLNSDTDNVKGRLSQRKTASECSNTSNDYQSSSKRDESSRRGCVEQHHKYQTENKTGRTPRENKLLVTMNKCEKPPSQQNRDASEAESTNTAQNSESVSNVSISSIKDHKRNKTVTPRGNLDVTASKTKTSVSKTEETDSLKAVKTMQDNMMAKGTICSDSVKSNCQMADKSAAHSGSSEASNGRNKDPESATKVPHCQENVSDIIPSDEGTSRVVIDRTSEISEFLRKVKIPVRDISSIAMKCDSSGRIISGPSVCVHKTPKKSSESDGKHPEKTANKELLQTTSVKLSKPDNSACAQGCDNIGKKKTDSVAHNPLVSELGKVKNSKAEKPESAKCVVSETVKCPSGDTSISSKSSTRDPLLSGVGQIVSHALDVKIKPLDNVVAVQGKQGSRKLQDGKQKLIEIDAGNKQNIAKENAHAHSEHVANAGQIEDNGGPPDQKERYEGHLTKLLQTGDGQETKKIEKPLESHVTEPLQVPSEGQIMKQLQQKSEGPVMKPLQKQPEGQVIKLVQKQLQGQVMKPAQKQHEGQVRSSVQKQLKGEVLKPAQKKLEGQVIKPVEKHLEDQLMKPVQNQPKGEVMKPAQLKPEGQVMKPAEKKPEGQVMKPAEKKPEGQVIKPVQKTPVSQVMKPTKKPGGPGIKPLQKQRKGQAMKPAEKKPDQVMKPFQKELELQVMEVHKQPEGQLSMMKPAEKKPESQVMKPVQKPPAGQVMKPLQKQPDSQALKPVQKQSEGHVTKHMQSEGQMVKQLPKQCDAQVINSMQKPSESQVMKPVQKQAEGQSIRPAQKQAEGQSIKPAQKQAKGQPVKPVQTQVERQVMKPVQKQTEGQVMKPVQKKSEGQVMKPVQKQTEGQVMKPVQKQTEGQLMKPVQKHAGCQVMKPVQKTAEGQVMKPVQKNAGQVMKPVQKQTKGQVMKPVQKHADCQVMKPVHKQTEGQVMKPVQKNADGQVMKPVQKQTEGQVMKPVQKNADGQVMKPVQKQTDGQVMKPVQKNADGQVMKPVQKHADGQVMKPVQKKAEGQVMKPVQKQTEGQVRKPVQKHADGQGMKPAQKQAEDQVMKPAQKQAEGQVMKPEQKQAEGQVMKPVQKKAEGQVMKPIQKQAEGQVMKPAQKQAEGQVMKPVQKKAEGQVMKPVQKQTEGQVMQPVQKETGGQGMKPAQKQAEGQVMKPVQKQTEGLVMKPVQKQADGQVMKPAQKQAEGQVMKPVQKQADGKGMKPAQKQAEGQVMKPVQKQAEGQVMKPVQKQTEGQVMKPAEGQVMKPVQKQADGQLMKPAQKQADGKGMKTVQKQADGQVMKPVQKQAEGQVMKPVQKQTEGQVMKPVQKQTEGQVMKPVQKQTEGQVMKPAQKQAEGQVMKPVQKQVDGQVMKPAQKQADGKGMKPVQKLAEGQVMKPVQKQAEGQVMKPVQEQTEGQVMKPVQKQTEGQVMKPAQKQAEGQVMKPVQKQADGQVMKPAQKQADGKGIKPAQKQAEGQVMKPVQKQAEGQVIKPVQKQADGQVMKPVQKQAEGQVMKPAEGQVMKPVQKQADGQVMKPAQKQADGKGIKPAQKQAEGQVMKTVQKQADGQVMKPVQKQAEGQVMKPVQKQTEGQVMKPVQKQTEGQVMKPVQKQTEGQVMKPAQKQAEGQVMKPVQKQADGQVMKPAQKQADGKGMKPVQKLAEGQVMKPVQKQADGKGIKPAQKQAEGQVMKPVQKQAEGQVIKPVQKQADGQVMKPAQKQAEGQVMKPVQKQADGKGMKPAQEQAEGQVMKPVQKQADGQVMKPVQKQAEGQVIKPLQKQAEDQMMKPVQKKAVGQVRKSVQKQAEGEVMEPVLKQSEGCQESEHKDKEANKTSPAKQSSKKHGSYHLGGKEQRKDTSSVVLDSANESTGTSTPLKKNELRQYYDKHLVGQQQKNKSSSQGDFCAEGESRQDEFSMGKATPTPQQKGSKDHRDKKLDPKQDQPKPGGKRKSETENQESRHKSQKHAGRHEESEKLITDEEFMGHSLTSFSPIESSNPVDRSSVHHSRKRHHSGQLLGNTGGCPSETRDRDSSASNRKRHASSDSSQLYDSWHLSTKQSLQRRSSSEKKLHHSTDNAQKRAASSSTAAKFGKAVQLNSQKDAFVTPAKASTSFHQDKPAQGKVSPAYRIKHRPSSRSSMEHVSPLSNLESSYQGWEWPSRESNEIDTQRGDDQMEDSDADSCDSDDSELDIPLFLQKNQAASTSSSSVQPLSGAKLSENADVFCEGEDVPLALNGTKVEFSTKKILNDQKEKAEIVQKVEDMSELMEGVKQGGFLKILNEEASIKEQELLPEHKKQVQNYATLEEKIQASHPGMTVFTPGRHKCLFTENLRLTTCGFTPSDSRVDKYLASIQPEWLSHLLTSGILGLSFQTISCPDAVLTWLFYILSVHPDRLVMEGCHKDMAEILVHQREFQSREVTWCPGIKVVLRVLLNYGASVNSLCPDRSLLGLTDEEISELETPLETTDNENLPVGGAAGAHGRLNRDNLRLVIQVIALGLQGRPEFTPSELIALAVILCSSALDSSLVKYILLHEIQVFLAALLEKFPKDEWPSHAEAMCKRLSTITSHHHNRLFLVDLVPLTRRGKYLQRRLSYIILCDILNVKQQGEDLHQLKVEYLAAMFPKLRALIRSDLYCLCSVVTLMDRCVGSEKLMVSEKEDLRYLIEVIGKLGGELRDVCSMPDTLKAKDVMSRVKNLWTFKLQAMGSIQPTLFAWSRNDRTQMKVETLSEHYSDSEDEEDEDKENKN